ncbi:ribonuclease P protein component 2 [Candidatus Woesearchaeota archaeon]|nr:ribonuclease P protein component 2 [Candidatus Woesearchaeota archaeon]
MAKAKTKPLLPTLREKKRYLAYEVISGHKFNDAFEVNKAIMDAAKEFLGNLGMAKAGIMMINDQFNKEKQRGLLRVSNKHLDNLRASLIFADKIDNNDVIIRSVGASGILKKAQQKYLN